MISLPSSSKSSRIETFMAVLTPSLSILFGFRNKNHFFLKFDCFNETLGANEGDEWIRCAARAAAVPDILPSLWTLAVSPKAWRFSG
jgi:hypothetical protein